MVRQEGALLVARRAGHAIDVVVPVAFDVWNAEQRQQREVLLHCQAGGRGQVFARDEEWPRASSFVPCRAAQRVDERFVQSLAALARDAAVASLPRTRERI